MTRTLLILITVLILALSWQILLVPLKIFRLKKKIKNNPFIGERQQDDSYNYEENGYRLNYRIKESASGRQVVEWLSLRRRLRFIERKTLKIKRKLDNFFSAQKWTILFRPSAIIVLVISLVILSSVIGEYSNKRLGHFKWIIAQITGISPEAIRYEGQGRFKVSGERTSLDREKEPVIINFNPLRWLLFSDSAKISHWSKKLNRYLDYAVTINETNDVWLKKDGGQVHGRVSGDKIIWDEPQRVGITEEVFGHQIVIEDGKLKILDE